MISWRVSLLTSQEAGWGKSYLWSDSPYGDKYLYHLTDVDLRKPTNQFFVSSTSNSASAEEVGFPKFPVGKVRNMRFPTQKLGKTSQTHQQ